MRVVVGTQNQKKVDTVRRVFGELLRPESLEIVGLDAPSGVPEAPHDEETYRGAMNRAEFCMSTEADASYFVGLESGLVERYGNFFEEAWAVVLKGENAKPLIGYSSGLLLPGVVVERMHEGKKHNEVMAEFDRLFNLPDDNRDTWSRYTGGNISRQISLEEAVRNAVIQLSESEQNLYNF